MEYPGWSVSASFSQANAGALLAFFEKILYVFGKSIVHALSLKLFIVVGANIKCVFDFS